MPVEKIPVEHKFGILSQSHRVNLERHLKQKDLEKQHLDTRTQQSSNAEQSDIEKLLSAVEDARHLTANELINLQANAEKILDRCKRKAGFGEGGIGAKTNLNLAWSELGLLSTCNISNVREETLRVLIGSLHEAPITRKQVPVLFQLADVVLKSLISDQIDIGSVHTIEVLLIEMSEVIFTRLYYHHLATDITTMEDHTDSVDQIYLLHKAVMKRAKNAYKSYPGIAATIDMVKNIIRELTMTYCPQSLKPDVKSQKSTQDTGKERPKQVVRCISSIAEDPLHDTSPFLWHALRVFQCATHVKNDLPVVNSRLHGCASKFSLGPQLQQILAVRVLCESAKNNVDILSLFLCLPHVPVLQHNERVEFNTYCLTVPPPAADNKHMEKKNDVLDGLEEFLHPNLCSREHVNKQGKNTESAEDRVSAESEAELRNLSVNKTPVEEEENEAEDPAVEWPSYLWIVYIECLTDICLHGLTSELQTRALIGNEADIFGLLDYALYDTKKEDDWVIRYASVSGITRVIHQVKSDPLKDGFLSLANRTLMRHMDIEKDLRVRESYKLTQATLLRRSQDASLHFSPRRKKPPMKASNTPRTISSKGIYEKIATNLIVLLLPRVEPLVAVQSQSVPPPSQVPTSLSHVPDGDSKCPDVGDSKLTFVKKSPKKVPLNRTTIRDELVISNALNKHKDGYVERAWKQVIEVVEDQFAKEVLEEEAYREELRQKELEKKLQELDTKEK